MVWKQMLRKLSNVQVSMQDKVIIRRQTINSLRGFVYLDVTPTNQSPLHEGIKRKLKSGNVSGQSVQNIWPTSLISKNINIKIYRTIILPVVLYGYETWSLSH